MHVPSHSYSDDSAAPLPSPRFLVAIPVYNEEKYISRVLAHVLEYADNVLVIDDGSTDRTPSLISRFPVDAIRHAANLGYGRALRDAFRWAASYNYDWVITMDCDEQHEPAAIPQFVQSALAGTHDIISGSRYMPAGDRVSDDPAGGRNGGGGGQGAGAGGSAPPDRRAINEAMTDEINGRLGPLGLMLTDSFCGFKAHRVAALQRMVLDEDGYAFPMQFWVQAAANGVRVAEIPVRLIYNDMNRTFGGPLNDPQIRLAHYRRVLHCEIARCADRLPESARLGIHAGCTCR